MKLLFDIGGTKTKFATSSDGNTLENFKVIDTPEMFESGILAFKNYFLNINQDSKIDEFVGGIAGPLNNEKSMIINAPNLLNWNNKPFKTELENINGSQVRLENDAALVGLGEATRGAGKDHRIVMFLTISTGIGGARITDKKIDESSMGFEPGHQLLYILQNSEYPTHLEELVSGTALKKKYGKDPEEIDDELIWREVTNYLAYGIHNSLLHWSPEIVVLGGSIMNKIKIENVKSNLNNIMKIFPKLPIIKKAELEDKGGLYGALALK